jgi:hypothetical protein
MWRYPAKETWSGFSLVACFDFASGLGSVENQDSPLRLGVIQAFDG